PLVCCKTGIGFGAPNLCGSHDWHGAPLGDDEIAATRENLGWHHPPFEIPEDVYAGWNARDKGSEAESHWNGKLAAYRAEYPELAAELERRMAGELPADWAGRSGDFVREVAAKGETIASRKASQNTINAFAAVLPEFLGGSADLTPSNLTNWKEAKVISNTVADGNYLSYGVREFGMSAIMNGIALHGGFIPFGGTFLMFSEYARNALRMAALMKVQSLFVYTHDSIGLGEDGPTHQPVEQISTLRLIPNMHTWRPCDAVESAVAWKAAVERKSGPTCLIFSRQNLKHMERSDTQLAEVARGGYVLKDCDGTPDAIIIATGSEVELAVGAADALAEKGRKVRVVSMPCVEVFEAQDTAYRESVLPAAVTARVAVEAGVTASWYKYVGLQGRVVGIDRFGESAPAGQLFKEFGFTVENVVKSVEEVL
ncbi:MAG: transketolase, partial [Gammaproteobacteria bacterium]|nr:transketolase [Gammaproteobacteria bacterium]